MKLENLADKNNLSVIFNHVNGVTDIAIKDFYPSDEEVVIAVSSYLLTQIIIQVACQIYIRPNHLVDSALYSTLRKNLTDIVKFKIVSSGFRQQKSALAASKNLRKVLDLSKIEFGQAEGLLTLFDGAENKELEQLVPKLYFCLKSLVSSTNKYLKKTNVFFVSCQESLFDQDAKSPNVLSLNSKRKPVKK